MHIINEIEVNKRLHIIEFGSGISTIYLSSCFGSSNIDFLSIDEDEEWIAKVAVMLKRGDAASRVELHCVPRDDVSNGWYSRLEMEAIVGSKIFDLVIVDGPSAYKTEQCASRREAAYFLKGHLSDSCSIFLDDTARQAEKKIAVDWARDLGFTVWDNSDMGGYSWLHRGSCFFSAP